MRQRKKGDKVECFDEIRKKWVPLTPEEMVRQFLIRFMVEGRGIPASHISVERQIEVNGLTRRYDLVVFNDLGAPQLVIECKAQHVQLTQQVVEQVGRYNKTLRAPFIGVSNGKDCKFFSIDFETERVNYIDGWPL